MSTDVAQPQLKHSIPIYICTFDTIKLQLLNTNNNEQIVDYYSVPM